MIRTARLLLALLLLSGCHQVRLERTTDIDEISRVLAGIPVAESSPLFHLTQSSHWMSHNAAMDASFARFQQTTLDPAKSWAAAEIPLSPDVIFYPFGGPDMAIPVALFPRAKEFILFGMEPPGSVITPGTMDTEKLPEAYGIIRSALSWYLTYTYFQTYQMDRWLRREHLGGAGPVMLVFLARSGATIKEMRTIEEAGARGMQIVFEHQGMLKTATYYQLDASNDGLARRPGFLAHVRSRGSRGTFLKAAACLPHYERFTVIRSFIARESALVLTDDAGLPYQDLVRENMSIKHYGRYVDTMPLFRACLQPDMVQAFKSGARPLPFEIGYNASVMRGRSSLVLATRIQ